MQTTRFGSHRALPGFELNICQGRALFPGFTFRAGISGSGQGRDLFNGGANFGLFKASANMGYRFRFGICGPAWAGSFVASQTNDTTLQLQNNSAHLGSSDKDAWAGGFFAGATVYLGVGIGIQVFCGISVSCRRWRCSVSWRYCNTGGLSAGVDVDLINLMAILAGFDTNWSVPGYGSSLDITGDNYGIMNNTGSWNNSIQPQFMVAFNLINLIPKVGQINMKLGRFGTGLDFGPTFSIVFPITFRMTHFGRNMNGSFDQYTVGNRTSSDTLPLVKQGTALGNPGSGRAVARIQWTIRTTFAIGIYGGVRVLWAINFGFNIAFPIGNAIPALRQGLFNATSDLVSTIGSTAWTAPIAAVPSDCGCGEPVVAEALPSFSFADQTTLSA